MKKRTDRFAYEEAEAVLDAFASSPKRTKQFVRAYRKFKYLVTAYAYLDFAHEKPPNDLALSYAWEDAQVAFTGHGEASLIGCVIHMWVHVLQDDKAQFKRTIEEAFRKAEAATDPDLPRRYISRWRDKPARTPEEQFNLPAILPVWGAKTDDWALDNGEDPVELSDQLMWMERADRFQQEDKRAAARTKAKGRLRLVPTPE
jgi:hypothetical protein